MPRTYGHSEFHPNALQQIPSSPETDEGVLRNQVLEETAQENQEPPKTPLAKLIEGFKGNE